MSSPISEILGVNPDAVRLAVVRMLRANRLLVVAGRRRWAVIAKMLEDQGFPRMTDKQLMYLLRPVVPLVRAARKHHKNKQSWNRLLHRLADRKDVYDYRKP